MLARNEPGRLHATMLPLIEQLQERLEQVRAELQTRHPQIRLPVGKGPWGISQTGYHIYLGAMFPDRAPDEVDSVVLMISLSKLETTPDLDVFVSWEDPSHHIEYQWQDGPVPWSLAAGSQLLADLPRLLQVFADAVARGYPSRP